MLRFAMALILVSPAAAQVSFGPARELTDAISGGLAFAKATDMDGDGDLDVLAAEPNAPRVLWWRNDGAGNFVKRPEWLWGNVDWEVIGLDDWNDDGRADVWLQYDPIGQEGPDGSSPRSFGVALNLGTGGFAPPLILGGIQATYDGSMETFVAEMNGDSRKDLVTRDGVIVANAAGGFPGPSKPLASYLWDRFYQASAIDIGDDGDKDLLSLSIYTDFRLMFTENLGTSGFAAPIALLTPDQNNRYGSHCVLRSGGENRVMVHEGNGEGTGVRLGVYGIEGSGALTPLFTLPLPATSGGRVLNWGFPVATEAGRVFLFSYLPPLTWLSPAQGTTRLHEVIWNAPVPGLVEIASFPGVADEMFPELANLNGDAWPDLLLPLPSAAGVPGSICDRIVWLAGKQDGGFESAIRNVVAGEGDLMVESVVDMDGDGDADVLAGTSPFLNESPDSPMVSLWRNLGNGGDFLREDIPHGRDWIEIIEVRDVVGPAGDWEVGDPNHGRSWPAGRMDFLAQTISRFPGVRRFEWFFQDESGTFHRYTAAEDGAAIMLEVASADWDGDGTRDLLTSEYFEPSWQVTSFRKGNEFSFGDSVYLAISAPGYGPSVVPVDIDRDGDPDLFGPDGFFGNHPGYWMENDGSGAILSIRGFPHDATQGPDLDRDGYPDYVAENEIVLSRPGLTFVSRPFPRNGRIFQFEGGFADLDGDGDFDVVSGVATQGLKFYSRIQWWENRGDLRFEPGSGEGLPIAPVRWAERDTYRMGDMDGDGVPDLVAASSAFPRLEWFRVTRKSGTTAFAGWMDSAGLAGHSAGPMADWDADGMANWDEFAFGSDPAMGDPSHPGRPRLVRDAAGMNFTFQRRSDAATAGVSYPLERSGNLTSWEDWTPVPSVAPAAAGYEKVTVPVGGGEEKEFFRIAIPGPP